MYPSSLGLKKFPKRYVTRGVGVKASKLKRYVCVTRGGPKMPNITYSEFLDVPLWKLLVGGFKHISKTPLKPSNKNKISKSGTR